MRFSRCFSMIEVIRDQEVGGSNPLAPIKQKSLHYKGLRHTPTSSLVSFLALGDTFCDTFCVAGGTLAASRPGFDQMTNGGICDPLAAPGHQNGLMDGRYRRGPSAACDSPAVRSISF